MPRFKITINEQAAGRYEYIPFACNLEEEIFCHCSYFLVYDMPQTDNHWKKELYGFVKKIKIPKVKSGDKAEYTEIALVEMCHGKHFCEDKENIPAVLHNVYDSEEKPHDFDYDMTLKKNQDIYIDALDKFYYGFLLNWLAKPDPDPDRRELDDALDKYLIGRRREMVPA